MSYAGSIVGARAASAVRTLKAAAFFWGAVAASGQILFALYVVGFYAVTAIRGDLAAWNKVLPHGIVAGDFSGNMALALHLALALIILIGGPLQLVPSIRARAPALHRWSGRLYVGACLLVSVSGFYLVWTRGVLGGTVNALAISLNAILVVVFSLLAWRAAIAGRFTSHRRWALRLFLAASGVWFFRVSLMFWIAVNGGPVGIGKELDGPVAVTLAYGQYLVPLAMLELYFLLCEKGGPVAQLALAGTLILLTLCMAVGIVMAALFMWLPRIPSLT